MKIFQNFVAFSEYMNFKISKVLVTELQVNNIISSKPDRNQSKLLLCNTAVGCSLHESCIKKNIAQPMELKDFTVLFLPTKGDFRSYKSFKIRQNSSIVYLDFIVPGNNDLFVYF